MAIARISFILRTISLLIMVFSFSFPAYAKYSGGSGDPFDPYRIATAEDLILLGESPDDYDKDFILTADIDLDPNLSGHKVFDKAVIAPGTNLYSQFQPSFTGVFDGKDHTISNLTIDGEKILGLFGKLGPGGKISNLGLVAVDVNGIEDYAGGIAGSNDGTIITSYSTGSVSSKNHVGGLVGLNGGRIIASYSSGTVSGGDYVGGLVGKNSDALVSNCYSTCVVSGDEAIGGLVGDNSLSTIRNCYSIGSVSGRTQVGGLCGRHSASGTVINCFWDKDTSGGHYSAGGWAMTTDEMMTESMYIGWNNSAWVIDEGKDYPRLVWENTSGEVIDYEYPRTYPGNGQDQPFELDSPDDLICMSQRSEDWDKNFVLTGDIDMSSVIGYRPPALFTGTFDGQNHILKNLMIDTSIIGSRYHLGVFGKIGEDGQVANLAVENADIIVGDDSRYVGGLCGENAGGIITNCYITGTVTGGFNSDKLGGLCGDNRSGTIEQSFSNASVFTKDRSSNIGGLCGANDARINGCYATGSVNTGRYSGTIGGLIGNGSGGTISNCYATGAVNSEEGSDYLGGLVGSSNYCGIIGCYSEGAVIANNGHSSFLGGLVGYNRGTTISNCYAKGPVSGSENSSFLGGLVGSNTNSFIRNCYSIGSVSGGFDVGGLCGKHSVAGAIVNGFWDKDASGNLYSAGGWAMTTAEMMTEATYVGWNNGAWVIDEGKDYPHLLWENTAGKVIDYEYPRIYPGDGQDQPFELDSPEDMLCMSQRPADWDKNFILTGNIDMSSVIYYQPPTPFTGNFDGQGHVLKNLTIDTSIIGSRYYLGVFGKIGEDSQVANLGVEDVNIISGDDSRYVGGLCGENARGTIICCFTTGSITGGLESDDLGGLCGDNERGTIGQSYSRVSISAGDGSHDVGGLCGKNEGTITDCYATGAISGGKIREVGGFCGENHRRGIILNCYSTGPVSGESQVGGFCGDKEGGDVSNVSNCLWDVETSGTLTSEAGTGLTTTEMQQAQTFLDIDWDFVDETANGMDDIWWILEGQDYPRLWWEAIE